MRGLDDGLEPRTAEPVHGERRHFDGKPGLEPDVPGEVDGVGGGLQGVAEYHVVEVAGQEPRALDGTARGVGRQVYG